MAFNASEDSDLVDMQAPIHPVQQLQGPFEESMMESINEISDQGQKSDAATRRTMLLEQPTYERVCAGRWKQRPGENFHPLWKICAQLSFGIHLIAEGLAKSEDEVMKILQTHVDDVDGFLESTTEDFDLARSDVEERLRYLKLPLEHLEVFDRMLEDRAFRISIVEGNEKIEHIVERTSEAMKDALKDVQKGLQSTHALGKYLNELDSKWVDRNPEHDAVFVAMVGNVEGWNRAFMDLHMQGNKLAGSLVKLAGIVAQVQQRAGTISRKMLLRPHEHDNAHRQPDTAERKNNSTAPGQSPRTSRPSAKSVHRPHKPLPTAPSSKSISASGDVSPTQPRSRNASTPTSTGNPHQDPMLQSGLGLFSSPNARFSKHRLSGSDLKQSRTLVKKPSFDIAPARRSVRPEVFGLDDGPSSHSLSVEQFDEVARAIEETKLSAAPVELPASMPENPPPPESPPLPERQHNPGVRPKKSRISLGLGLGKSKAKSKSNVKASSTKPAGKLPRTPRSPRRSATPQSTSALGKHSSADPLLRTMAANGHFSHDAALPVSVASLPMIRTPVTAPITPQIGMEAQPEKTLTRNPAFTSHPPGMDILGSPSATSGGKLEASVPTVQAIPDLDSKHTSYQSSLGEPGPEISTTASLSDAFPVPPLVPVIAELDSTSTLPPAPVELEGVVPVTQVPVELEAPVHGGRSLVLSPSANPPSIGQPLAGVVIESPADVFKLPLQASFTNGANQITQAERGQPLTSDADHVKFERSFCLPSAESGVTNPVASPLSPQSAKQSNGRPNLPLLVKKSWILQSNVIDHISSTPPGSPIHRRSTSITSLSLSGDNSARASFRASKDLAPPEEAPAPPGPGGRSMVSPDFASAGAFEGERKAQRPHSSNLAGLKNILSQRSPAHSKSPSVRVIELSEGRIPEPALSEGVDMMTAGGKDVLWFKGMSREGVWLSGS